MLSVMKSHRYYTGIPQKSHRYYTGIPLKSHRNPTDIIQQYFAIQKKFIQQTTGGGTEGGATRGVFICDYIGFIPAAVIIGLRRPYPPCLSLSFFCVRVFLVFPLRHCHSLRFLFLSFLVFLVLSFLL